MLNLLYLADSQKIELQEMKRMIVKKRGRFLHLHDYDIGVIFIIPYDTPPTLFFRLIVVAVPEQ